MLRYKATRRPCTEFCAKLRTLKRIKGKLPSHKDLLVQFGNPDGLQLSWTLGTWEELQQRDSCSFCQLVVSALLSGRNSTDGPINPAQEISCLLFPDEQAFRLSFVDARLAFLSEGGHDASGPDNARAVVGSSVQPGLVQKWLRTCQEKHRLTCGAQQQTVSPLHFLMATPCRSLALG